MNSTIGDNLRAALRSSTGDPDLDAIFASSLSAALPSSAPEQDVFREERAPRQAQATIHLQKGTVEGHSAPAMATSSFIDRFVQVATQIAKSRVPDERRVTRKDYRIEAFLPGSLAVVLSAPDPRPDEKKIEGQIETVEDTSNVQSDALRETLRILGEVEAVMVEDRPDSLDRIREITGDIPAKSIRHFYDLAGIVQSEGWNISGEVIQFRRPIKRVSFSSSSAVPFRQILQEVEERPHQREFSCRIDGFKGSNSTVFLIEKGTKKAISYRIREKNSELFLKVRAFAAAPDKFFTAQVRETKKLQGSATHEGTNQVGIVDRELIDIHESGVRFEQEPFDAV